MDDAMMCLACIVNLVVRPPVFVTHDHGLESQVKLRLCDVLDVIHRSVYFPLKAQGVSMVNGHEQQDDYFFLSVPHTCYM